MGQKAEEALWCRFNYCHFLILYITVDSSFFFMCRPRCHLVFLRKMKTKVHLSSVTLKTFGTSAVSHLKMIFTSVGTVKYAFIPIFLMSKWLATSTVENIWARLHIVASRSNAKFTDTISKIQLLRPSVRKDSFLRCFNFRYEKFVLVCCRSKNEMKVQRIIA